MTLRPDMYERIVWWIEGEIDFGQTLIIGRTADGEVGVWRNDERDCAGAGFSSIGALLAALNVEEIHELIRVAHREGEPFTPICDFVGALSSRAAGVIFGWSGSGALYTNNGLNEPINSIEQLTELTEIEFGRRKNCGRKTVAEVKAELARRGLSFKQEAVRNDD